MSSANKKRSYYWRCAAVILIASVLILLLLLAGAYLKGKFDSVETLQAYIARCGSLAPLALTLFQSAQVVCPVLPGFFGCMVGALLFGTAKGFWCNYIGISAGSVIAFSLAKKFGKPLLDDLFSESRYRRWTEWASRSRSYTAFLFMAMVLPLFPDDFFCYLTGLTDMKTRRFIWIIVLGKPWCIVAYSIAFGMIR